jgi:hypothetical protein
MQSYKKENKMKNTEPMNFELGVVGIVTMIILLIFIWMFVQVSKKK